MNYSLSQAQRQWQARARAFAQDEMLPLSLQRDAVADPFAAFDWDIIKKGSRLGFRTAVVGRQWGGHGIDFVTQALVMAELAKADSAITKTFSQCWKWRHLIAEGCTDDQKARFLTPFIEDDTFLLGHAGTEPNAGSDHRLPPEEDPRAGWKLKAEQIDGRADAGLGGHSINNVLLMNFAADVIQRVTRLNMDIHGGAGVSQMDPRVDKLSRDAIIWTHLAGDSVQRMKAVRRLKWN